MSKKSKKLRAPTDATLRNVRAANQRALNFAEQLRQLEARVDAIERWQEAAATQAERVERDNVEGGQEP